MSKNPITKEEIIAKWGSWKAYIGPRPTKCECKGTGIIPPHPKPGENRCGCPYHRYGKA